MTRTPTDYNKPVALPQLPEGFRHLPENTEAEQALLGAILNCNEAYDEVRAYLRPEHFYEPVHRRIFEAILCAIEGGDGVDPITLAASFRDDEALRSLGGARYLTGLANASVCILNPSDYGELIADLAAKRAMIGVCREAANILYDPTCPDRAEAVGRKVMADLEAIANDTAAPEIRPGVDVFRELLETVKDGGATIPTGFACLDKALGGGFRLGSVYAIEGRDKAFKSGFCAGIAEHASIRSGVPCLMISLELSPADTMQRLAAGFAGIGFATFDREEARVEHQGHLIEFDKMLEARRRAFFLAHRPGIDLRGLLGLMSQGVAKHGVKLIIVDYWQLVRGSEREQPMSAHLENVANSLAEFARKNDVVVFIASQLNRQDESLGSDGLRRACSWLARIQPKEPDSAFRWLLTSADRYGRGENVGNKIAPAFMIRPGPVLREVEDSGRSTA